MAGATPEETDRLVVEAISEGNVDALLELFEPTALFVDPGTGNALRGHDEIRTAVIEMFKSKPRLEGGGSPTVWISGDIALVCRAGRCNSLKRTEGRSRSRGRRRT